MPDERTFSGDQLQALLKRASQLQGSSPSRSEGAALTLEEIEHVAESAGLNPAYVRQAVQEMDSARVSRKAAEASDTHLYVERWIDMPMSRQAKETIQLELSHLMDVPLEWSISNPFEWTTQKDVGDAWELNFRSLSRTDLRVLLQPWDDQLRLRLSKPVSTGGNPVMEALLWSLLVAGPSVPAFIIAFDVLLWALMGVLLVYMTAVLVIHQGLTYWRDSQHQSLEKLADQLSSALIAADKRSTSAGAARMSSSSASRSKLSMEEEPSNRSAADERSRTGDPRVRSGR